MQTYLAHDLMKMSPKDGWVTAPDHTWVLAGGARDPVLIYSLSGSDIQFVTAFPGQNYKAIWEDPRTGSTHDAQLSSISAGAMITKPDEKDWLLLLTPQEK